MPANGEGDRPQPPERPEYTVYRSRPSLRDRFRKPDLEGLRERLRRGSGKRGKEAKPEVERPLWRRIV
jgi:hypothetical protein